MYFDSQGVKIDLEARFRREYTLTTAKGAFSGTLIECLEHHAREQGAFPEISWAVPGAAVVDVDIGEHSIALDGDPYASAEDLSPKEAATLIRRDLLDALGLSEGWETA